MVVVDQESVSLVITRVCHYGQEGVSCRVVSYLDDFADGGEQSPLGEDVGDDVFHPPPVHVNVDGHLGGREVVGVM